MVIFKSLLIWYYWSCSFDQKFVRFLKKFYYLLKINRRPSDVMSSLIIIFVGGIARLVATYFIPPCKRYTHSERLLIAISWMPKAVFFIVKLINNYFNLYY